MNGEELGSFGNFTYCEDSLKNLTGSNWLKSKEVGFWTEHLMDCYKKKTLLDKDNKSDIKFLFVHPLTFTYFVFSANDEEFNSRIDEHQWQDYEYIFLPMLDEDPAKGYGNINALKIKPLIGD